MRGGEFLNNAHGLLVPERHGSMGYHHEIALASFSLGGGGYMQISI